MDFFLDVLRWFADPSNWRGTGGIPNRVYEHLQLSGLAVLLAVLLAAPAGMMLGHLRRGGVVAVAVVNIGRALPSFGILALALLFTLRLGLGLGFWPTFAALFLLALPPVFTNSYTGVHEVPGEVVESARGMGMREREILQGIEFPLALPVIAAAVRVAAVQVVATAPLGALVAWGGLGRFIIDGLAQRDFVEVTAGAILVAGLALLTDAGLGLGERLALPGGMRPVGRAPEAVQAAHPV